MNDEWRKALTIKYLPEINFPFIYVHVLTYQNSIDTVAEQNPDSFGEGAITLTKKKFRLVTLSFLLINGVQTRIPFRWS